MMKQFTWEEALQNQSFVKGQIEIHEENNIYRGPIKEITVDNNNVLFHLTWCAKYNIQRGKWVEYGYKNVEVIDKTHTTIRTGNKGRFILQKYDIIVAIVSTEDGNQISPKEVEGLNLD